jgi:DNA-binding XRE family transcriptional regulator
MMARAKPTAEDIDERRARAQLWKLFRKDNLFTQIKLAKVLRLSRRTVQQIEGAKVTPHPETIRVFASLKRKYDANSEFETKEKEWLKAIT